DCGEAEILVLKSFDRAIVDVCIGYLRALRQGSGIHSEPVVLGCDKDPSVLEPDGLVCPPVPELQLVSIATECKSRDLVAHADPENRQLAEKFPDAGDRIGRLLG